MVLVKAGNGLFCPEDPGEPGGGQRWSVNEIEGRLLSELFRGLDVLEIGTGLGISTKFIASQAEMVFTVDVDEWVEKNVVPSLPHNTRFFRDITDVPRPLDAAFIDGMHTPEAVARDIDFAMGIVKKGGLIVFHDLGIIEVHNAIVDSPLDKKLCIQLRTGAGMAICWNERE